MKIKKLMATFLCLALAGSALAGCSSGSSSSSSSSDTGSSSKTDSAYKFAFLPNTQNNSFQSTMNDTFKKLCEEKGYEYVCLDPDYDVNKQLGQMSDVANQDYDAVFVIPVDSQGIRQGLEAFKTAKVPVINVDTAVVKEDRDLIETIIATDCVMAGKLVGQEMVKKYPDGAKIAILDFPENESCVDRVNGFLEGLGDSKDKFQIVAQQNGKAALDASLSIAEDIIQANPDIDAFFCINDPSALGAAAAVKSSGKSGIGVYSIDASPEGKAALVDGTITCVAAQVPIQIAETAFEKAIDLLNGKTIEKEIYLPSKLITVDMAKETAGQWQ